MRGAPPPPPPPARRDATSLAHQYDCYAQRLELSVVDNVLLVRAGQGGAGAWAGSGAQRRGRRPRPPGMPAQPGWHVCMPAACFGGLGWASQATVTAALH